MDITGGVFLNHYVYLAQSTHQKSIIMNKKTHVNAISSNKDHN